MSGRCFVLDYVWVWGLLVYTNCNIWKSPLNTKVTRGGRSMSIPSKTRSKRITRKNTEAEFNGCRKAVGWPSVGRKSLLVDTTTIAIIIIIIIFSAWRRLRRFITGYCCNGRVLLPRFVLRHSVAELTKMPTLLLKRLIVMSLIEKLTTTKSSWVYWRFC